MFFKHRHPRSKLIFTDISSAENVDLRVALLALDRLEHCDGVEHTDQQVKKADTFTFQ